MNASETSGETTIAAGGVTGMQRGLSGAGALGWQIVELYADRLSASSQSGAVTPKQNGADDDPGLPGSSSYGPDDLLKLRRDQIGVSLTRLDWIVEQAGLQLSDARTILTAPDPDPPTVERLHLEVMRVLEAADFRLGKAYSIGRVLGNLCFFPGTELGPSQGQARLLHKLDKVRKWLSDLRSIFPAHVAQTIIGSIDNWEAWILLRAREDTPSVVPDAASAVSDTTWLGILTAMPPQTKIWRNLVSGDKLPQDRLSMADYERAGESLVVRYRNLATAFAKQWWMYLVAGLVVVGGVVAAIAVYGQSTATKVVGLIVTLGAALGVTGKTASATLTRTADSVGTSLWEAELDDAMALAATQLPTGNAPPLQRMTRPSLRGTRRKAATAQAQALLDKHRERVRLAGPTK
jgi:hypothetical protein